MFTNPHYHTRAHTYTHTRTHTRTHKHKHTHTQPAVENPALLDYNPLELARQFTLLHFELFTSIKPREYVQFSKSNSWAMHNEEQEEEDPANVKNSPHIVGVMYRFTDVSSEWCLPVLSVVCMLLCGLRTYV